MGAVSIRELNSNVSKVIARVEGGEVVEITKGGTVVAEIRPRGDAWLADPQRRKAREELLELMREGIPGLAGPATYEERTGR